MIAIPAHIQAMMDAYVAETGIPVRLSYSRQSALSAIHALPVAEGEARFGAADVAAVLREIKRLLAAGKGGVTDASLDFRNCLLNVDTFEERARKLRQRSQRAAGARRAEPVEGAVRLADGSRVLAMQPAATAAPAELAAKVAEGLREFRRKLGGAMP